MNEHLQCQAVIISLQKELDEYKQKLSTKNEQIELLKGIIYGLKDDLNLKDEQFDYLFSHILDDTKIVPQCLTINTPTQPIGKNKGDIHLSSEGKMQRPLLFTYFSMLNINVTTVIFNFLDYQSLTKCSAVCKIFHQIANSPRYWKLQYYYEFGEYLELDGQLEVQRILGYPTADIQENSQREESGESGKREIARDKNLEKEEWESKFKRRHTLENRWNRGHAIEITLNSHGGTVTCIDYNPKLNRFATGSEDGSGVIWMADSGVRRMRTSSEFTIFQQHHRQTQPINKLISLQGHGGPIWCISMDNNLDNCYNKLGIATGSYDRTIKLWNAATATCEATFRGHTEWVSGVALESKFDKIVSTSWDSSLRLWHIPTKKSVAIMHTYPNNNAIYCLQSDLTNNLIATGCRAKRVDLWDAERKAIKNQFVGHTQQVNCLKMVDNIVVSGGGDGIVRIWDTRTNEEGGFIGKVRQLDKQKSILSLQYDPQTYKIITGGYNTAILIYDIRNIQSSPLCSLAGHSKAIFSLASDYFRIISGSADNSIKIWDFNSQEYKSHNNNIQILLYEKQIQLGILDNIYIYTLYYKQFPNILFIILYKFTKENMENKEANKLIYGIKWENKELLDELERRGIFENLNFIITGLYLAARFRKGRSYQRLANNLENWKHSHLTGNNFKPKSGDKESEELDQLIKGATKKVDNPLTIKEEEEDRLDSNIINTSNVHNELTTKESSEYEMVSKESWTYKLLMLHTLYSCITISDQTIILYVIQDYALTITAKLVYILLKNELFDVIKEIISHNIPIINDQGSIEEYALFQNLSTLSNLRQFYISNKSRLCPADMVDFMLKNKLDQLKTNKFIKECKNLKDNTIIEILLKHNQEFWAEKLIKENFDYSDGVVIAAIKHECFMFLLFYIRVTSGELFELEEEIIELIIEKIADDVKHIEYYLFLLLRYKQYVSLAHSKTFFNQINKCLSYHEAEIAFVIGQPNPMKITILIIELVLEIMKSITVMKIMGNKILADLISFVQKMQAQVENENQLRQIFYDKDIANREVINIIGSNNLISLLENKNMQVIISDIWSGPYPLEGKMRQTTSSLYFLLAHGGKTSRDLELINRPKIFIRNIHTMKYHPYQFMAWKDGINIRYLFEAGIFVLLFYLNFSSSNELHDELLKFLKDFLRKALPPGSSNFEDINYAVLPDKFKADWKALIYIIYTIMMSRLNLIYIYIFLWVSFSTIFIRLHF